MDAVDLAGLGSKPERLCCDTEEPCRIAEVEPGLAPVWRWPKHWDPVMRPECGNSLPRPAIAVASDKTIPVEDTSDQVVISDQHQLPHGSDDVARGVIALFAAAAWQAQFCMNSSNPMDHENDVGLLSIDIGDYLVDEGTDDALLEPGVRRRG